MLLILDDEIEVKELETVLKFSGLQISGKRVLTTSGWSLRIERTGKAKSYKPKPFDLNLLKK